MKIEEVVHYLLRVDNKELKVIEEALYCLVIKGSGDDLVNDIANRLYKSVEEMLI